MGSLAIKNKFLRCEKCFMLKLLTIEPDYPQTTVCSECFCGLSRQSITAFSKELIKEEIFKVKCSFCNKEPKHPSYCTGCRRTYCTTCKQAHDIKIETKTPHRLIDSYKYDFYCSTHQEVLVSAYCKSCSLNICQNCINEKLHKAHRFIKFSKLILSPNDEENLKNNIKINYEKIESNVNRCTEILRLQSNPDKIKEIKEVCNTTVRDNKSILALIKYLHKLYTDVKHKNYAIIFNVSENIKFNPQQIAERESLASIEQNTNEFLEYLKRDFVLFKRFNAPKIRSNTTIVHTQKKFLNKKLASPIKEEEENNENNKKLKTDDDSAKIIKEKKENDIKINAQKREDNYLRVFGTQRENEKKEKDKKNNIDINLNEKKDNIIQIPKENIISINEIDNTEPKNENKKENIIDDKNENKKINIEVESIENKKMDMKIDLKVNTNSNDNKDLDMNQIKMKEKENDNNKIVDVKEIINDKNEYNAFTFDSDEEINIDFNTEPQTKKEKEIINVNEVDETKKVNINLNEENKVENESNPNNNIDKDIAANSNNLNNDNESNENKEIQKSENNPKKEPVKFDMRYAFRDQLKLKLGISTKQPEEKKLSDEKPKDENELGNSDHNAKHNVEEKLGGDIMKDELKIELGGHKIEERQLDSNILKEELKLDFGENKIEEKKLDGDIIKDELKLEIGNDKAEEKKIRRRYIKRRIKIRFWC